MAMSNLKDQPHGTLRITCPDVTATYFMPEFLGQFAERFPRISIELLATNRHLDLIKENVDFAFRVGPVASQTFITRKISSIRRVLVAAPGYLAANPKINDPNDLIQHRCLLHDALPDWTLSDGTTRTTLAPPAAAKSDSLGFLLQSCIFGSGISLLPAYICQPAIAAGRLTVLLPNWDLVPYDMALIFPDRTNQSKAQTAFRDFVDAFDFSRFAAGISTA
ncbi:substrate binding domain-containing protein [Pacificispira spongiicola]|nr:substrate binding domain-containing protein [Pacificispira spongiicola]